MADLDDIIARELAAEERRRTNESFLSRVLRRGKEKLTDVGRQIGADLVEGGRDINKAVGMAFPPVALANALRDRLMQPEPREQAELTQGPWYGTSSDPGVRVLAMAAGAGAPGGKAKAARGLVNLKLREKSAQEALASALREEHLIEGGKGSEGLYIGGPRNITSRPKLAANRRRMDTELDAAARRIEDAGEVVGDWYPSQRRGIAAMAEPWQQRRAAQETAHMSSQTDPYGERGFMVQANNRLARGEPVGVTHTGRQGREFAESLGKRDIKLGEKTGNYALLSDPSKPETIFGTNDFRQAQFHGYTEPSGAPQTSGLGPTQHAFLDAEGLLLTDRANRKVLGGRTDWTGAMAQEVSWIGEKADSFMRRFPKRFPNTPEGRNAAIREASKTGEDANLHYAAGANYERLPGRTTGHDPSILDAPWEERVAYSREAPWYTPEGRDVIYRAQGLYQLPTTEGVGIWQGKTNPNFTAKPLADFERGSTGRESSPGMLQQLKLGEHLRGLIDVQDASVAHIPVSSGSRKAGTKTHALLEHEGSLSEPEMRALAQLAPDYTPTPTPRGTMLMQWKHPSSRVAKDVAAMQDPIAQGQLNLERVGMDSTGLIPVFTRQLSGDRPGLPIAPGRGIATARYLRQAARSPAESVTRLGEDESVRKNIGRIHERDEQRKALGKEIREDVQATRRFFRDVDWPKVVAMLRENPRLKVGAAMAALGYSLEGMAAEDER